MKIMDISLKGKKRLWVNLTVMEKVTVMVMVMVAMMVVYG
jgi:hypothetical protein